MKTPFSVFTNLAYIVSGPVLFFEYPGPFGLVLGFFMVIMGLMSAYYHLTYETDDQMGDRRGMYLLFATMLYAAGYAAVGVWIYAWLIVGVGFAVTLALMTGPGRLGSMQVLPALILPQLAITGYAVSWSVAGFLLLGYLAIELFRELPEDNFWTPHPAIVRAYDWIHGTWHIGTAVIITINAAIILEAMP